MQNRDRGLWAAVQATRVRPWRSRRLCQDKAHARRVGQTRHHCRFENSAAARNVGSARRVAGKAQRRKETTRNGSVCLLAAAFPCQPALVPSTGLGLSAAPMRTAGEGKYSPLTLVNNLPIQKITGRDNLDADPASLRQHEFVAGHQRHIRRRALSATNFRSSGSSITVKAAGSTGSVNSPSSRKRSATRPPIEPRDPSQDHLGFAPGRLVPDQPEAPFADAFKDARGGAFRVEERGHEHVGIDHDAFHAPSASAILIRQTPVNSQKGRPPWPSITKSATGSPTSR